MTEKKPTAHCCGCGIHTDVPSESVKWAMIHVKRPVPLELEAGRYTLEHAWHTLCGDCADALEKRFQLCEGIN